MGEVVRYTWMAALAVAVVGACSGSSTTRVSPAPNAGGDAGTAGNGGSGASGTGAAGGRGGASNGSAGRPGSGGTGGTFGDSGAGGEGEGEGGAAAVAGSGALAGSAGSGPRPDCDGDDGIREGHLSASGELAELRCVKEVRGLLSIELEQEAPRELELLERVRGDLRISGPGRATFSIPRLTRLGGLSVSGVASLEELSLPSLELVEGRVSIAGNPRLTSIDWSALSTIDGDLQLGPCRGGSRLQCEPNDLLTRVSLPALESTHGLFIGDNPLLERFEAPLLRAAGDIRIPACAPIENDEEDLYGEDLCTDLPSLESVELGSLEQAGTIAFGPSDRDHDSRDTAGRLPLLGAVRLPALAVATHLALSGLPSIAALDLGSLTTIGDLHVAIQAESVIALDLTNLVSAETLHADSVALTAPELKSVEAIELGEVPDAPLAFPALTSLQSLSLASNGYAAFDCSIVLPHFATDLPSLRISGSVTSLTCDSATSANHLYVSAALPALALPELTDIGELWLSANPLTTLSLPKLRTAGVLGVTGAPALTELSVPLLESAGTVSIDETALTHLALPQLVTVTNRLSLWVASGTTSVALDALTSVGTLHIFGDAEGSGIQMISLPALTTAGSVSVHRHPNLTTFSAPLLGPSMSALTLAMNPVLALPTLPALTSVEALTVIECPGISQCEAEAWAMAVSATCNCRDNGSCSP